MADVFLSYAHEDTDTAEKLARLLSKNGLDVWWDRRLFAGDDLNVVIERALEEARCAIVLWSPHSVVSHWVRGEAQVALDLDKLVPIQIAECKLPINFRDLNTPCVYRSEDQIVDLAKLLTEKLAGGHAPSPKSASSIKGKKPLTASRTVVFSPKTRSSFLEDLKGASAKPGDTLWVRVTKQLTLWKKHPVKMTLYFAVVVLSVSALYTGYWYYVGDCADYYAPLNAAIEQRAVDAAHEFKANGKSARYLAMVREIDTALAWMPRQCLSSVPVARSLPR
jgi:hypothetical protein